MSKILLVMNCFSFLFPFFIGTLYNILVDQYGPNVLIAMITAKSYRMFRSMTSRLPDVFNERYFYENDLHVIYQTRETVFHRDIQTPRRELKIRRAAEYF